jgi:hypothetical protein
MSEVIIKTLWVYGLAIVVSLGVAVVIKVIVLTLGRLERKPAVVPPLPVVQPAPLSIEAHHVAAIAAAVHAMGGAHRVVHIEAAHRHQEWAAGGRQAQHASHAPPHHPKH